MSPQTTQEQLPVLEELINDNHEELSEFLSGYAE
jgi:hypothetical protein